jgi:hypothetical protein
MDASLNRNAAVVGAAPIVPAPTVPQGAVKTELPPPRAVEPPVEAEAVRLDINPNAERRAAMDRRTQSDRRFQFDPETQELIALTVNRDTGEVIAQFPEEWRLRLAAYNDAQRERQLQRQAEIDELGGFLQRAERVA